MRQRNTARDCVSELLEEDTLAEEQQQEVIVELQGTLIRHSRTWRTSFGILGLVLAAGLTYFAACQVATPWVAYRHHSEFKGILTAPVVALYEALSAACLAAPAFALLRYMPPRLGSHRNRAQSAGAVQRSERWLLTLALWASVAMTLIWGAAIVSAGRQGILAMQQQVRLLWLPVMPLAFTLLAISVVRTYADTADRIKALEAQMYNLQSA